MRKSALLTVATLLLIAGSAQARSYSLINCHEGRDQDHYAVTALPPGGCSFGRAAYQPMFGFALSGVTNGSVLVRYKHRTYALGCVITNHMELLRCGHRGKPWDRLYLDSGGAPQNYQWPTHT
jgi:hypothetical protein